MRLPEPGSTKTLERRKFQINNKKAPILWPPDVKT